MPKSPIKKVAKVAAKPAPKMTKTQLYTILSERTGLSRKDVGELFEAYTHLVLHELKKGGEVKLPDLGKFKVRRSEARTGRNPANGKEIVIPAKTRAKFLAAKVVREAIK